MRERRALSPLVATGILISIAVVGGLVLYNYFYKTMGGVSNVNTVAFTAKAVVVGTNSIIHYQVWNTGSKDVTLISIEVYSSNGSVANISIQGVTVPAGESYSGNVVANSPLDPTLEYIAILNYGVGGSKASTDPVKLSVSG